MHLGRLATATLIGGFCWQAAGVIAQQESVPATSAPTSASAPSQETDPATQPDGTPTFRADVNFVRVDVIVTDRNGEPVADLTADDFQVFEDDARQTIEQFKLVNVDGNIHPGDQPIGEIRTAADQEREIGREDVRLFVIFFDDYHTRAINALKVKRPLTQFVENHLGQKDLVAIMYPLTPLDSITFTRRQTSLLSAINNFEGRKYDYEPRNSFELEYSEFPTEEVERIRNQVVMDALRGLSIRLGGLREGRKAVLFVSEGLGSSLPANMRFRNAQVPIPDTTRPDSSLEDTFSFFNHGELMARLRRVFDAANRNNAAFYPFDPRGLAVSEFQIDEIASPLADRDILRQTQDTNRALADETDGRAFVGQNNMEKGLAQMVKDSSAYYLLGYNSSQAPDDGKFHEIKVRLSDRVRPRRLQVRTRKGYLAPTIEDVKRATAPPRPATPRPVQQALASMVQIASSGRFVRSWIGLSRGDDNKTRVTYVWEPLQGASNARREMPGRVSLLAATEAGDLVFRGKASAPGSTENAGQSPPAAVAFDVTPGTVELRTSVEGGSGGVLDTDMQKIVVPDLALPGVPSMSTPRVYRARTARDVRALAKDALALPRVGRDFSRTERILIRLDVYGDAAATAALLNRQGQKMVDLPLAPAEVGGTHQLELPLGSLAPGEYVIEITATEGGAAIKALVPLKVGQ